MGILCQAENVKRDPSSLVLLLRTAVLQLGSSESDTGLSHSKTLRAADAGTKREASWSAAVLCRFGLKRYEIMGAERRTSC